MKFSITIQNIQHIELLKFSIDLTKNRLMGIVGRNGVGKTTLMKALQNLRSADTFKQTSSDGIFRTDSVIAYRFDDDQIQFTYDSSLSTLSSKQLINESIRNVVDVELPIPHGKRFNFFKSISEADAEIRRAVVLEDYTRPDELIDFLHAIYGTSKFEKLAEIRIKGIPYYCIILPDSRYIREDYLSSGEYFLINLYRKIQSRCKLIAIDEIDLSLDAAAQVHLIDRLRKFCGQYQVNILFSTHSLAMMQTLEDEELFEMRFDGTSINVVLKSYAYIKSTLFGFRGWDRYILTEDKRLQNFLEHIIKTYCKDIFYEYKIIYVGTADSVLRLMERNETEEFFSGNVISILDGDMRKAYRKKSNVLFIPFDDVEKQIRYDYEKGILPRLNFLPVHYNDKSLFEQFIKEEVLSEEKMYDHLCLTNEEKIIEFAGSLNTFLTKAE